MVSVAQRALWVRALARDISLTVPHSTRVSNGYRRIYCWGGAEPCDGLTSHPDGSKNTLSRFMLLKPG